MQSTLGNSNCNFIKELLFIYSEQPPGCPAISWPRVASHSDPDLCWGWGLGSGRRTLLWRATESTCSCELWPSLARLQLDAVYVDCLMANWCSMCWKHSFRHEAVMGGNMGCLNMIPISTVNLVNSVKKQSSLKISQNSYQRLLRQLWLLDQFFHVWISFPILCTLP